MKKVLPKYRPVLLMFISTLILMMFFMICRFCGLSYFANNYTPQPINNSIQAIINYFLKALEAFAIIAILTDLKWYKAAFVGFTVTCIYFVPINNVWSFIFDLLITLFVPFILNKFRAETIPFSFILIVLMLLYQALVLQARYTIDLSLKFNYIAGIVSVLDYKLFVFNIYFIRRLIDMQLPAAESNETKDIFGGGHCFFLFGPEKLKTKAALIGHIIGFPIFVIIYGIEYTYKLIKKSCKKEN